MYKATEVASGHQVTVKVLMSTDVISGAPERRAVLDQGALEVLRAAVREAATSLPSTSQFASAMAHCPVLSNKNKHISE